VIFECVKFCLKTDCHLQCWLTVEWYGR